MPPCEELAAEISALTIAHEGLVLSRTVVLGIFRLARMGRLFHHQPHCHCLSPFLGDWRDSHDISEVIDQLYTGAADLA